MLVASGAFVVCRWAHSVGCGFLVSVVMSREWAVAVGVVGSLKRLGMFAWEMVHNGAAKGAPGAITHSRHLRWRKGGDGV